MRFAPTREVFNAAVRQFFNRFSRRNRDTLSVPFPFNHGSPDQFAEWRRLADEDCIRLDDDGIPVSLSGFLQENRDQERIEARRLGYVQGEPSESACLASIAGLYIEITFHPPGCKIPEGAIPCDDEKLGEPDGSYITILYRGLGGLHRFPKALDVIGKAATS